ncbi:DctP9 protein [Candidatus Vecturithrix granuli]|uniref:DctP9 protein n=1 Tax=Vecturithrix granuli TaxID=1499967 RepID=A0A081C989_VECG1|nr:DctP9 protein [Candidatus Vecturithrix granuli]
MKKYSTWCLVVLLIALICGQASAKVVIKVANAGPANPDNRTVKAVDIFKALVEKGTNGEIEVQAYHASSLGNEREALEGVKMGTIEMATLSSGPVPGFFAPVMVFDIPYLFSSAPAAWNAFNGQFGQEFNEAFLKETGVRILSITENGYRHFTNNVRPIKTPADMKALKIRTMENPAHMEMTKSLGANPTPIAFGELYMALQQKVVDGMECPIVLIHDMKFYEVQKYMVLDGHLYNPLFVFMNENFYQNKLTPEQQKVVAEAANVLAAVHNGFSQEANIQGIEKLKAQGMEIYQPTKEELAQYREIAQPAALAFIKEKAGEEWVQKALEAAKAAEEAIGDKADAIIQEHIDLANQKYQELVAQ